MCAYTEYTMRPLGVRYLICAIFPYHLLYHAITTIPFPTLTTGVPCDVAKSVPLCPPA